MNKIFKIVNCYALTTSKIYRALLKYHPFKFQCRLETFDQIYTSNEHSVDKARTLTLETSIMILHQNKHWTCFQNILTSYRIGKDTL